MKKIMVFVIFTLFVVGVSGIVQAQVISEKRFEFSIAASYWNIKYADSSDSDSLLNIPLRLGFYIYKGLEIESELILTIPDESEDTGYLALFHLVYNHKASDNVILFVLGGAGVGNGQRFLSSVFDWDTGVTAYDFGVGMKYLMGKSAAIRMEYRYTQFKGEKTETFWGWTYTDRLDRKDHNVFIGLSIFF